MAQSFDYERDKSLVSWNATITYNMMRMTVGGILLFLIVLATAGHPLWALCVTAFGWLLMCLPAWMVCQKLPDGPKGFVALLFVVPFLLIGLLADPLILIASKVQPALIPVEKPGLMTFNAVIFVLKPV